MRRAPLLALLLALSCSKAETKSDEASEKSSTESKKKKPDDDEKKKKPKADDEETDDKEAPKKTKKKKAEIVAPERTKTPTVAEWNGANDVKAAGNEVGCEVRAVREWVRVSCRKKSPGGGTPSGVVVEHGKSKDTFVFSSKGVTSVVAPLLPGTDLEAKYSWTDVVYAVSFRWHKDEERPDVFAHFVKTDDAPTKLLGQATCACFQKNHPGAKCDDTNPDFGIVNVNPWCESSYAKDCELLMGCATGSPGAMPKCPATHQVMYPGNFCTKKCKTTSDCGAGFTCIDHPFDPEKFGKICEDS